MIRHGHKQLAQIIVRYFPHLLPQFGELFEEESALRNRLMQRTRGVEPHTFAPTTDDGGKACLR